MNIVFTIKRPGFNAAADADLDPVVYGTVELEEVENLLQMGDQHSGLPHFDTSGEALIQPDVARSKLCRKEFYIMCWTFGLNHATVTTPIIYASSVLTNSAGQAGNAMLYGTTLICSLFLSSWWFSILGAKKGLSLSMGAYTIYVVFFAIAVSLCAERAPDGTCKDGGSMQLVIVLIGSFIGGMGAGLLWTAQGSFFAGICEQLATAELKDTKAITAELASVFAFIFLFLECGVRVSSTLMNKYAKLSWPIVFYIFAGLAFLATVIFITFASDMAVGKPPRGSVKDKLLGAMRLWKDPKLLLLQATNITFGFAASWNGGYIGRYILSPALSKTGNGATFIGFAGAIISGIAAILSRVFGCITPCIGKGPVVALGAVSFLMLGVLSKWVGNPVEWGWGAIVFSVLMGFGRAVYESTNKAIFADFFPGDKAPYAFANVMMFGTGSSTIAFILGAVGDPDPELYLLVAFAAVTVPFFVVATMLKNGAE